MARTDWSNLHVQTAAGNITGSIQRICAGHASNAVTITSYTTGIFKSLKYPNGDVADITGSQNDAGTTSNDDLTVAANSCIDGPFIAIHADADDVLIYHNGIYNTVAD